MQGKFPDFLVLSIPRWLVRGGVRDRGHPHLYGRVSRDNCIFVVNNGLFSQLFKSGGGHDHNKIPQKDPCVEQAANLILVPETYIMLWR